MLPASSPPPPPAPHAGHPQLLPTLASECGRKHTAAFCHLRTPCRMPVALSQVLLLVWAVSVSDDPPQLGLQQPPLTLLTAGHSLGASVWPSTAVLRPRGTQHLPALPVCGQEPLDLSMPLGSPGASGSAPCLMGSPQAGGWGRAQPPSRASLGSPHLHANKHTLLTGSLSPTTPWEEEGVCVLSPQSLVAGPMRKGYPLYTQGQLWALSPQSQQSTEGARPV